MGNFEIKNGKFYLDNEPFRVMSGAIHYFRTLPEYWSDRLDKLKACGLNTVETYVAWNMHEPREGQFCFDGICDLEKFIELAGEKGLKVIVRPSPYICAEWEFGGFPAWLLKKSDITLRAADEYYLEKVSNFYKELIPRIAKYQITNGGPVIMVQIENEYGSYGNDADYLRFLKDCMEKYGINVPMFTSDGETNYFLFGGTLPEVYKTVNFFTTDTDYAFRDIKAMQPDMPIMVGEFWCGWFDHWGEEHCGRSSEEYKNGLEALLKADANFNIYMFHGGTNFGFMNGANHSERNYKPDTTSYDYDCLLSENGEPTEKYYITKELIEKYTGKKAPGISFEKAESAVYGTVKFTQYADIFSQLDTVGVHHTCKAVHPMEYFGQNYGYILYRTTVPALGEHEVGINDVHDIAYFFVNGKFIKRVYRNDGEKRFKCSFTEKENVIEILVENYGRVNYGRFLHDRKGITENVVIGNKILFDWDVYCFEMDNTEKVVYTDALPEKESVHGFLRGTFTVDECKDTYVNTDNLKLGQVFVNGFNLGRYWTEAGPQHTLYLPAGILKKGENEIVVFENEGVTDFSVSLDDKPIIK